MQSFKDYLRKQTPTRDAIDRAFKDGAIRFDPELGHTPGDVIGADGIDSANTIATLRANGARTSHVYAGSQPRINSYGSSFARGSRVSDAETWQEYLAGHLGEPIGNFGTSSDGVYQAYRRMLRVEASEHGARYVILCLWGEDHRRSLYRRGECLLRCNIEVALDRGKFVERASPWTNAASTNAMTDPDWLESQLLGDHALELAAFVNGHIDTLRRAPIDALATSLGFRFDWSADTAHATLAEQDARKLTPMQKQAEALLDRYSLQSTQFVLEQVRNFVRRAHKKLLVVLFDPIRALPQMAHGQQRYDQSLVDYLREEDFRYFDMNEIHLRDYDRYKLTWNEYIEQYLSDDRGHYGPRGNHFFAYASKEAVKTWLNPAPLAYRRFPDIDTADVSAYVNDL